MEAKYLIILVLLLTIFSNLIYAHEADSTNATLFNVSDTTKWPEIAGNKVIDAIIQIDAAQSANKNVSSAKSELDEAIDFYKLKDYSSSYMSAQNALQIAINISKTNSSASIIPTAKEDMISSKQFPQYAIFGGLGIFIGLVIGYFIFRAKKV